MKGKGASGVIKTLIREVSSALKGGGKGHQQSGGHSGGSSSVSKKIEREVTKRKKGGRL